MSRTAFDTLKLARRLQAIGLPPAQADGFAEVFSEVMVTDLATKTDLTELRSEFRLECEKIRTEIAASRSEILRWIVPLILAQMALTVGVLLRMRG
ncbi:MAG: hypothetical protein JNK67_08020 [Alphaproteobacteria bacterium]|nr:hypothetical protein [Alphaproteobacteria bacterium]